MNTTEIRRRFAITLFPVTLAVLCFALHGWAGLVWGYFISTTILWHTTFFINSLCHLFGRRRFPTKDTSRNSLILALVTLGEGWHNNHHRAAYVARQGLRWWEVDLTWYVLLVLERVGVIWDVKRPRRADEGADTARADATLAPDTDAPDELVTTG